MLLKEFTERALKLLDGLDNSYRPELDILVKVESRIACDDLKQKLIDVGNSASREEANESTLDPFIYMLKMRWRSIRLTDANYCHTPDSPASRAFLQMAEQLAAVTGKKPYHYLFSVTKEDGWDPDSCKTSKGTLHDLKLNEFVFADHVKPGDAKLQIPKSSNNLTLAEVLEQNIGEPIEVVKCLTTAATQQNRVLETTCSLPARYLNAAEETRVALHSTEAHKINSNLKRPVDVKSDIVESTLRSENDDKKYIVQSTYGKEGRDRLLTVILSNNDNAKGLARVLSGFVQKDEWATFLKEISLEDMQKIVLQKKTYKDAVANPEIFCGNELQNTALLYSMAYLYRTWRDGQADHTTMYGRMFYAYTKKEKLAAADVLLAYLSSDIKLSLDKFLEQTKMPEGIDCKRCKGAIYEGDLGYIAKAVTKRFTLQQEPAHGLLYT